MLHSLKNMRTETIGRFRYWTVSLFRFRFRFRFLFRFRRFVISLFRYFVIPRLRGTVWIILSISRYKRTAHDFLP